MKSKFSSFLYCFLQIVCAFVIMTQTVVAQEVASVQRSECTSWRGNPLPDNLNVICLSGDGLVQSVHVDTTHSLLYALYRDIKKGKVRSDGKIVAYNFDNGKELWSIPFDFDDNQFFLADSIPVISGDYTAEALNWKTGITTWKNTLHIGMVTRLGVGIAKSNAAGYPSVVGIDLRNGEERWRKRANFKDIDAFEIHGDTAAVFLKKGLNYINLDTGLGFYIEAKTMENIKIYGGRNVGGAAVAGALGGLIGGLIFGAVVVFIPVSAISVSQTSSNNLTSMYMNPEGIFFTSKTGFYKVGYDGEIDWSVPVEKSTGAIRKIFVNNDAAFMISKGMLATENGPMYSDVRLYRMNVNGEDPFQNIQLNTGKREYVQDFLVKDSTIIVALNNKVMEISLKDLSIKKEKVFGKVNQNSGFGDILNPPAIVYRDSVFEMASKKYPESFYVANKAGMKIRFSEDFAPVEVIREKNYFGLRENIPQRGMLISNGKNDYLVDEEGVKEMDIAFSANVKYRCGWFFDFDEGKIFVVKPASDH